MTARAAIEMYAAVCASCGQAAQAHNRGGDTSVASASWRTSRPPPGATTVPATGLGPIIDGRSPYQAELVATLVSIK